MIKKIKKKLQDWMKHCNIWKNDQVKITVDKEAGFLYMTSEEGFTEKEMLEIIRKELF